MFLKNTINFLGNTKNSSTKIYGAVTFGSRIIFPKLYVVNYVITTDAYKENNHMLKFCKFCIIVIEMSDYFKLNRILEFGIL